MGLKDASPLNSESGLRLLSWIAFAACTLALLLLAGYFITIAPKSRQIFEDFGLKIPFGTKWLLAANPWLSLIAVAAWAGLLTKELIALPRLITLIVNLSILLLMLALTFYAIWALFEPLLILLRGLGPKP